jgi:cytochrome c oxidase subunit 2
MDTVKPVPARARRATWLRVVVLAAGCLPLAACTEQPATTQAADVQRLYFIILGLAAFVFVVVEGTLLFSIVRFRRRRGDDEEPPQRHGTTRMLILFFAFGAVIVAILFPFGEMTLADVEAHPVAVEQIVIQGSQWQWSAFYPNEGVVTSGKSFVRPMLIETPIDETVHIHLISNDVMHEFFIPAFMFMRNALPGHPNDFVFTPNKLGTFQGQCAEFCGLGHARMTFVLKVVTQTDFDAWVKRERRALLQITCPPTAGDHLQLTAHNISWNTNCLAVTPGSPFSITIQNLDAGIDHNFAIYDTPSRTKQLFSVPKFAGVATKSFDIPALAPGSYYFQCNVHGPAMSGVFKVVKQGGGKAGGQGGGG